MSDDARRIAELERDVRRYRDALARERRRRSLSLVDVMKTVSVVVLVLLFFVPIVTLFLVVGAIGLVMSFLDRIGEGSADMARESARVS